MLAIEPPVTSPRAEPTPELPPQRLHSLARAARHDVLRRMAPPLRHDMVVHLQSLGMMAEALSARLERGQLPGDDLQGAVSKLNRLARQAVSTCVEVSTWMQPAEDDAIELRQGVAECVRLLSTSLNFRGFELRTELAAGDFAVSHSAVRFLLAGAIFTVADAAAAPGELAIRTELGASEASVAVDYAPQPEGSFTQLHESGEAPLAWNELEALAAEAGAELLRRGTGLVLRLPRAVATSPLKMVPV